MSLKVWLPLDGNVENKGTHNATITLSGATVNTAGKIGSCYSFDGTDDYIQLYDFYPNGWAEFSLSVWVYPTADFNGLFLIRGGSAHRICINVNGFVFRDTNNSTQRYVQFASTVPTNVWTHLTYVYKRGEVWLYQNGVLSTHNATYYNASSVLHSDLSEVRIARVQSSSGNVYFTGKLNDFRIYDHALSTAEVHELAQGLVMHYKLDGEGNIVVPKEYQQLEYIESTGTQRINTGIVPQSTYKIKFKYNLVTISGYKGAFGAYQAETANAYRIIPVKGSKTNVYAYFNSKANSPITINNVSTDANQIIEGLISQKELYLCNLTTGGCIHQTSDTDLFPTKGTALTSAMTLFGYGSNYANCRIYYFDMLDGDTSVMRLIPAKRISDDVLGMYDLVSGQFFENSGTGIFTAGSAVGIGTIVYDSSGYGRHGTPTAVSVFNDTPRYNCCSSFNGTSAAIKIPFTSALGITSAINIPYSISLWFRKDDNGGDAYSTILGGQNGFEIDSKNNTTTNTLVAWNWGKGTYTYENNVWYHFGLTNNTTKTKWYINGELFYTGTSVNIPVGNFYIGAWSTASKQNYFGYVSDVRVYATNLSEDDIKELYRVGLKIDNRSGMHTYELQEGQNQLRPTAQGLLQCEHLEEGEKASFFKDKHIKASQIIEI